MDVPIVDVFIVGVVVVFVFLPDFFPIKKVADMTPTTMSTAITPNTVHKCRVGRLIPFLRTNSSFFVTSQTVKMTYSVVLDKTFGTSFAFVAIQIEFDQMKLEDSIAFSNKIYEEK